MPESKILELCENLGTLFIDMSVYIMLGLLFVGILHAFIKKKFILKQIGDNSIKSVIKAAIIGVPLPLCSCGVVPTAVELKKSGASNGAVASFLIATPETSVDNIFATYSLMGPIMAILRPIVAFISGIFGGTMVNTFAKNEKMNTNIVSSCCCEDEKPTTAITNKCCCEDDNCDNECECGSDESISCGCENTPETKTYEESEYCCFDTTNSAKSSCSTENEENNSENLPFFEKIKKIFTYAYGTFLDDISVHFVVGIIIAAIITTFIPADLFISLGINRGILAMLLMVLIGLPMYICSTASIPIALSLMLKGLSPGTAFVFLVAGPVTNIVSILILFKTLGKKVTLVYILSIIISTVTFGLLIDLVSDRLNFSLYNQVTEHASHSMHGHSPFTLIIAAIFFVLILKGIYINIKKKFAKN